VKKLFRWSEDDVSFLRENYPQKGLKWCAESMGLRSPQIRQKASDLGLKQDRTSDFFKEWQAKARESKIGKKRPRQSEIMTERAKNGDLPLVIWAKEHGHTSSQRMKDWYKNNPHPKGASGMKHSAESLQLISEKSKISWSKRTDQQRIEHSLRCAKNGHKVAANNRHKTSWKSGWSNVGGKDCFFRSSWELNYAQHLEFLKVSGDISEWFFEEKLFQFKPIPGKPILYKPDFIVIKNDGSIEYHEVKGWMCDRSKSVLNRMSEEYPEVNLLIIGSAKYKKILEKEC
jgi:hypothetical protein